MAEWQWKRWDAVARLGAGKLTLQEAAQVLGLSVRQVRRIRQAVALDDVCSPGGFLEWYTQFFPCGTYPHVRGGRRGGMEGEGGIHT